MAHLVDAPGPGSITTPASSRGNTDFYDDDDGMDVDAQVST
jgi:hypothetical protein